MTQPIACLRVWLSHERCRCGLVVSMVLLCGAVPSIAQDVTESSLKAAFIYNFARFTEWPADVLPSGASFNACVLGETPVAGALGRTAKGRPLFGHRVSVTQLTQVARDQVQRSCHLLYVTGIPVTQAAQVVKAVEGLPVLTLVDLDGFPSRGGIAHLFVEKGKLRFALDLELARRSGLQLSSKLVQLATRIHTEAVTP